MTLRTYLVASCMAGMFSFNIATAYAQTNAVTAEISEKVKQFWQQDDYASAKALLTPYRDKNKKDADILALLGQTEAGLRNLEEAESLLAKAVKIKPDNADYQHWYATASCNMASNASMFSALGYAKRCKKAYEKALELAPDNPRSYIALGSYYAQAPGMAGGDKQRALELAQQLKTIDAIQGSLLQLKATDLSDEATFNNLLADDPLLKQRPESYFSRGMALSRDDKHSDAISYFTQALAQPAADEDAQATQQMARYQLARSAVKGKTSLDEGVVAIKQFIADEPEAEFAEWAQLRLGQLLIMQQQTEQAQAILQPLLASTDDDKIKDELKKLL